MALPPRTGNDRGETWHKIKGKALCSVCLSAVYLSHRHPPRPHPPPPPPSNPLTCTLWSPEWRSVCFYRRHYRKWVWSSKWETRHGWDFFHFVMSKCCVFLGGSWSAGTAGSSEAPAGSAKLLSSSLDSEIRRVSHSLLRVTFLNPLWVASDCATCLNLLLRVRINEIETKSISTTECSTWIHFKEVFYAIFDCCLVSCYNPVIKGEFPWEKKYSTLHSESTSAPCDIHFLDLLVLFWLIWPGVSAGTAEKRNHNNKDCNDR